MEKQELELIDITEMLNDYFRIFRRMWARVLILTILCSGLFYVKARIQYVPMYTASAVFTINIQNNTNDELGVTAFYDNAAAEQMAKTFPYILTSGVLRRRVAEDMGTDWVSGNIQASVAENTNLLTISVTDQDAGRAYAVLESVVKNYPTVSEVIIGRVHMEMLDETGIPPYPDNPKNFKRDLVKGMVVGLGIGFVWCALVVVTRRTVRKEKDLNKYVNIRCIGTVPQIAVKRRTNMYSRKVVLLDEKIEEILGEPMRLIRNKVEHNAREYHNKTFMVTSALAGEGKSTVAVNLALSLLQTGKKVALIDCDLRHPSDRQLLGIEDGEGLGDILQGKAKLAECIWRTKDLKYPKEQKFLFLPGGTLLEDGAELLGTEMMGKVLYSIKEWADYVILDSAPVGLLTDAAVLAQYADAAIYVVRKDFSRVDVLMEGLGHLADSHVQVVGGVLNGV